MPLPAPSYKLLLALADQILNGQAAKVADPAVVSTMARALITNDNQLALTPEQATSLATAIALVNQAQGFVQLGSDGKLPALDASQLTNFPDEVTAQGNDFNTAGKLLLLDGAGKIPALDASQVESVANLKNPSVVGSLQTDVDMGGHSHLNVIHKQQLFTSTNAGWHRILYIQAGYFNRPETLSINANVDGNLRSGLMVSYSPGSYGGSGSLFLLSSMYFGGGHAITAIRLGTKSDGTAYLDVQLAGANTATPTPNNIGIFRVGTSALALDYNPDITGINDITLTVPTAQDSLALTGNLYGQFNGRAADRGVAGEVYLAVRTDGWPGFGTKDDPFDVSDQTKLTTILDAIPDGTSIYFGPGTFYCGGNRLKDGWKIRGCGMDVTVLKAAQATAIFHTGYSGEPQDSGGIVIEDMTFDANSALAASAMSAVYIGASKGAIIRRCRAINYTSVAPDEQYVFVIGAGQAATSPYAVFTDRQCIMEVSDCVVEQFLLPTGTYSGGTPYNLNAIAVYGGGPGVTARVLRNRIVINPGQNIIGINVLQNHAEVAGNLVIGGWSAVHSDTGGCYSLDIHDNIFVNSNGAGIYVGGMQQTGAVNVWSNVRIHHNVISTLGLAPNSPNGTCVEFHDYVSGAEVTDNRFIAAAGTTGNVTAVYFGQTADANLSGVLVDRNVYDPSLTAFVGNGGYSAGYRVGTNRKLDNTLAADPTASFPWANVALLLTQVLTVATGANGGMVRVKCPAGGGGSGANASFDLLNADGTLAGNLSINANGAIYLSQNNAGGAIVLQTAGGESVVLDGAGRVLVKSSNVDGSDFQVGGIIRQNSVKGPMLKTDGNGRLVAAASGGVGDYLSAQDVSSFSATSAGGAWYRVVQTFSGGHLGGEIIQFEVHDNTNQSQQTFLTFLMEPGAYGGAPNLSVLSNLSYGSPAITQVRSASDSGGGQSYIDIFINVTSGHAIGVQVRTLGHASLQLTATPSTSGLTLNAIALPQNVNVFTAAIAALHLGGQSYAPAPAIVAGAGAGSSPTIAIDGTDVAGRITLTTGSSPSTSGPIASVTFGTAYPGSKNPVVILLPDNSNAVALSGASAVYTQDATTFFNITASTVLAASTAYAWKYHVLHQSGA